MKNRILVLDIIKGFAIILVVLGHSIQYNQTADFDNNLLFRIIYSFHMPLFMFISGFIALKTFDGSNTKLWKRFKSLVIPFFAWFVIGFFVKKEQPDFLHALINLIINADTGLWFLFVLFLIYVILYAGMQLFPKYLTVFIVVVMMVLNVVLHLPSVNSSTINLLSWHLFFFYLGYLTAQYQSFFRRWISLMGPVTVVLFCILVPFWSRLNITTLVSPSMHLNAVMKLGLYAYRYLVPICGIYGSCFLLLKASRLQLTEKLFCYPGTISLEIYSVHFYLLPILVYLSMFAMPVRIIMTFVIALALSMVIQLLIKKVDILAFVLFGKPMPARQKTPVARTV